MDDTEQGDTIYIGTGPRFGYGDTIHIPFKREGADFWENTSHLTDGEVTITIRTLDVSEAAMMPTHEGCERCARRMRHFLPYP